MSTTKNHVRKKSGKKNGKAGGKFSKGSARGGKKWSAHVTEHSDAMDLKQGVFTSDDPKKIAKSVERSAEKSGRKKSGSYQSAMSMLNFYINRAGKNLPAAKKKTLTKAKDELKEEHEKKESKKTAKSK